MSDNATRRVRLLGLLGVLSVGLAAGCASQVETPVEQGSKVTHEGTGGGGTGGGAGTGGIVAVTATSSSTGGDPSDLCWKDFGPDAPGVCTIGEERQCPPEEDDSMTGYCLEKCVNVGGEAVWGAKTYSFECPFYDTDWHIYAGPQCACNTPLVLSFDGAPVAFTAGGSSAFDLTRDGVCHASDWPSAATPWLALDRDGNGAIDDGGELFGSATTLGGGAFATNGFEALRELDANRDGVFDALDPAFAKVFVWTDRDLDRRSSPSELSSLASAGVTAIDLRDRHAPRCDARGNCEGERSQLSFVDAGGKVQRGSVIDVYLPTR